MARARMPSMNGYYWMRVKPTADWAVVELSEKIRWHRCEPMSIREFRKEYPNAEWGDLLTSPEEKHGKEAQGIQGV
jgi:hypothetical protein